MTGQEYIYRRADNGAGSGEHPAAAEGQPVASLLHAAPDDEDARTLDPPSTRPHSTERRAV